jgi:membrane protein implicated in regulation of membrane protease activity
MRIYVRAFAGFIVLAGFGLLVASYLNGDRVLLWIGVACLLPAVILDESGWWGLNLVKNREAVERR